MDMHERMIDDIRACMEVESLQRVGRAYAKEIAETELKMSEDSDTPYDFARHSRYSMQLINVFNHEMMVNFLGLTL